MEKTKQGKGRDSRASLRKWLLSQRPAGYEVAKYAGLEYLCEVQVVSQNSQGRAHLAGEEKVFTVMKDEHEF